MYRVILADDNQLVRQALQKTIPWKRLGLQVVAEVEDGVQVKESFKQYQPDLLVMDIRMPGMSGLEVTEYLRKHHLDTKVIIITGYQEFEYAKQAIKLGVYDFIVKPIRDEELIRVLKRAVRELNQEREEKDIHDQMMEENLSFRKRIEDTEKIVLRQALRALAHGRTPHNAETLKRMEKKKWVYVFSKIREQEEPDRIKASVTRMLEFADSHGEECMNLEIRDNGEAEFLFFTEKEISVSMANIRLKKQLSQLGETLKEEIGVSACFTVSNFSNGLDHLEMMRNQALKVMETHFFTAREMILFSWHYNVIQMKKDDGIFGIFDRFYREIEEWDQKEIPSRIKLLLKEVEENTNGDEFQIKCLLSELCITLYRNFYLGKLYKEENAQSIHHILDEINALGDIRQVEIYLEEFVARLHEVKEPEQKFDNPLVGKTIQYLKEHFGDSELSLTGVAESLNVNASYLSRLLKKEVGVNFIDILTSIRIKKAKQLLDEERKVAEVGVLVGYKDYTYFYQVFKKSEGIAPTEYKKGNTQGPKN